MQWVFWVRVLLAILSICGVLCLALVVFPMGTDQRFADGQYGLPDGWQAVDAVYSETFPEPFSSGHDDIAKHVASDARLYRAALAVETPSKPSGQQFPAQFQQAGDCVSQALCNAYKLRIAVQVKAGRPQRAVDPFPPYTYGVTRVLVDGPKLPCRSAGAYPSSAVEGLKQFGVVTAQEAGVPYSGRLADDWGCNGPPEALVSIGKQRSGDAYPIRSAEEGAVALANGYPLTLATNWKPDAGKERDGRIVCQRGGRWAHAMSAIAFDGSVSDDLDRKYFLIWNSHGKNAHKPPLGDEPQGSFWVDWPTFDTICRTGTVYAINDATGFPADDIDWSIFDKLKE